MSKASRMFRSRSNHGANLAFRPVAELDVPTFSEADLGACLAALYNSATDALAYDFSAGTIPAERDAERAGSSKDGHALLSFTPKPSQPSQPDEVLAVLLQTIDCAASTQVPSDPEPLAAPFSDEATIITASSLETRRTELFIVEKPLAAIRPP